MPGVIDTGTVLKVVIPPLVQGGVKLFDFGKTRGKLAAAQKQIAEKDRKLGVAEDQLRESTTRVVAVTEELVEKRKELVDTLGNLADALTDSEQKELYLWGAGAVIIVLLVVIVFTHVNHA
jgi:hypothetical protein